MLKNINQSDKIIRIVISIVLFICAFTIGNILMYLLVGIAIYLIVTIFLESCFIYTILGYSSKSQRLNKITKKDIELAVKEYALKEKLKNEQEVSTEKIEQGKNNTPVSNKDEGKNKDKSQILPIEKEKQLEKEKLEKTNEISNKDNNKQDVIKTIEINENKTKKSKTNTKKHKIISVPNSTIIPGMNEPKKEKIQEIKPTQKVKKTKKLKSKIK